MLLLFLSGRLGGWLRLLHIHVILLCFLCWGWLRLVRFLFLKGKLQRLRQFRVQRGIDTTVLGKAARTRWLDWRTLVAAGHRIVAKLIKDRGAKQNLGDHASVGVNVAKVRVAAAVAHVDEGLELGNILGLRVVYDVDGNVVTLQSLSKYLAFLE